MTSNLETYLRDHLAAAAFAIDLVRQLCRKHRNDEIGARMSSLLLEIEADRDYLQRLARNLGFAPSRFKQAVARVMEKLSRPKLIKSEADTFSSFQALETIALGILGKKALWEVLSSIKETTLAGADFEKYKRRALVQHTSVEKMRLALGAIALAETYAG